MKGIDECGELGKLSRSETAEKVLYGFIKGVRRALPGVSVEKSIDLFMQEFGLEIDNFNPESAAKTYYRLLNESI